jgi:hypothetical protein
MQATGGGGTAVENIPDPLEMLSSHPVLGNNRDPAAGETPNGWAVEYLNETGVTIPVTAWAVCAQR